MATGPSYNCVTCYLDVRKAAGQGMGARGPGQVREKAGPSSQRPTKNRTISGELRENSALFGVICCYQEARAQDQSPEVEKRPRHI